MARPVALYLMRFDMAAAAELSLDLVATQDQSPIWVADREDDPEALLAAAREAGHAEGAAAARAEAAAEQEQARRDFDEELAAERQKWLREEGETLKERLATALRQMQDTLAECVGQILRPFVIDSLRRQMLGELVEQVASMAASHDALVIKITGPADLLALLQEKLAELPLAIDYEQSDGVDVRVVAAQTMIETRLQAWIDLISAKME
ncbi:MAG: hypothetical protein WCF20_15100 [Methylovirgula sp.]